MPPPPPNSQAYRQSIIDAREAWAKHSGLTQAQVKGAYQQAATSLGSRIASVPPTAPSTAWNLTQYQQIAQDYANTLDQRTLDAMYAGINASFHDSADSVLKADAASAYGGVFGPEAIDAHVRGTNQRAAAAYITRTGPDGIKLSDRVWKANQQWRSAVQGVVQDAVISGRPPVQIAREIEQYLQPGVNVPYKAETAKRLKVPKDTSMPAMRVARTELQNAFHEGTISSHSSMPSYLGIRWVIASGLGHETDICDEYAAIGFFPKGSEPLKPHPHCFCTAVPVHRDADEVLKDLDAWLADPKSRPDLEQFYQNELKPLLDIEVASVAGAAGGPLLGGYAKGDKVLIDVQGQQVIATIAGEHASKGVLVMYVDDGQGMAKVKVWRAPSKVKPYTGPPAEPIPLTPIGPTPQEQIDIVTHVLQQRGVKVTVDPNVPKDQGMADALVAMNDALDHYDQIGIKVGTPFIDPKTGHHYTFGTEIKLDWEPGPLGDEKVYAQAIGNYFRINMAHRTEVLKHITDAFQTEAGKQPDFVGYQGGEPVREDWLMVHELAHNIAERSLTHAQQAKFEQIYNDLNDGFGQGFPSLYGGENWHEMVAEAAVQIMKPGAWKHSKGLSLRVATDDMLTDFAKLSDAAVAPPVVNIGDTVHMIDGPEKGQTGIVVEHKLFQGALGVNVQFPDGKIWGQYIEQVQVQSPPLPSLGGLSVGQVVHATKGQHTGKVGTIDSLNVSGSTIHVTWEDGSANNVVPQNLEAAPPPYPPGTLVPGTLVKFNSPETPQVHGQNGTVKTVKPDGSLEVQVNVQGQSFIADIPVTSQFKLEPVPTTTPAATDPQIGGTAEFVSGPPGAHEIIGYDPVSGLVKIQFLNGQKLDFDQSVLTNFKGPPTPATPPPSAPTPVGYIDMPGDALHGKAVAKIDGPGTVQFMDGTWAYAGFDTNAAQWNISTTDPTLPPAQTAQVAPIVPPTTPGPSYKAGDKVTINDPTSVYHGQVATVDTLGPLGTMAIKYADASVDFFGAADVATKLVPVTPPTAPTTFSVGDTVQINNPSLPSLHGTQGTVKGVSPMGMTQVQMADGHMEYFAPSEIQAGQLVQLSAAPQPVGPQTKVRSGIDHLHQGDTVEVNNPGYGLHGLKLKLADNPASLAGDADIAVFDEGFPNDVFYVKKSILIDPSAPTVSAAAPRQFATLDDLTVGDPIKVTDPTFPDPDKTFYLAETPAWYSDTQQVPIYASLADLQADIVAFHVEKHYLTPEAGFLEHTTPSLHQMSAGMEVYIAKGPNAGQTGVLQYDLTGLPPDAQVGITLADGSSVSAFTDALAKPRPAKPPPDINDSKVGDTLVVAGTGTSLDGTIVQLSKPWTQGADMIEVIGPNGQPTLLYKTEVALPPQAAVTGQPAAPPPGPAPVQAKAVQGTTAQINDPNDPDAHGQQVLIEQTKTGATTSTPIKVTYLTGPLAGQTDFFPLGNLVEPGASVVAAPTPPPAVIPTPAGATAIDVTQKGTKVITEYQGQQITGTVTSYNAGKNVVTIKPDDLSIVAGAAKNTFTKAPGKVQPLTTNAPTQTQQPGATTAPVSVFHMKTGDTVVVDMPGTNAHGQEATLVTDPTGKGPNDGLYVKLASGQTLLFYGSDLKPPSAPIAVTPSAPGVTQPGAPTTPTTTPATQSAAAPQMPKSLPPDPPPPVMSEMKVKPMAVEGGHAKTTYSDQAGETWMFKPDVNAANAEKAGYNVQQVLGLATPEMHVMSVGGQVGSMQRFHAGIQGPVRMNSLGSLTAKQRSQIQEHQVVDWLISQHDTNDGALLIAQNGDVVAVDKGQAFKFFGRDKLDWKYAPNPDGVVYKPLFEGYIAGRYDLDRSAIEPILAKIEALDDDVFKQALKPYAEHAARVGFVASEQAFYDQAIERKHKIRADFEAMYDEADKQAGKPPRQKPTQAQPTRAPAPGTAETARQVTPISKPLVTQIERAGWAGHSVMLAGEDIESGNALAYTLDKPDGTKTLAVEMRLRPQAEAKLLAKLDGVSHAPSTGAVADPMWTTLLPAIKHVGFHLKVGSTGKDDKVTASKIQPIIDVAKQVNSGSMDPGKAEHYKMIVSTVTGWDTTEVATQPVSAVVDQIEHWWRTNTAVQGAVFDQYVAPSPTGTAAAPPDKVKAKTETPWAQQRVLQNGVLVTNGGRSTGRYDGHEGSGVHTLDLGPGLTGIYTPFNMGGNVTSKQGRLVVYKDNFQGDENDIQAALDSVSRLGVDSQVATQQDMELLYLRHQAHAMKLENDPGYKQQVNNKITPSMTVEEKIAIHQAYFNQKLGVPDVTKLPGYSPTPKFDQTYRPVGSTGYTEQEGGYAHFDRFDISQADIDQALPGYGLTHNTSQGAEGFVDVLLDGNGQMANTEERIRSGVYHVGHGMSSSADMGTGGADYFFTRISKQSDFDRGQFVFDTSLLLRTDLISYDGDRYGRTAPDAKRDRNATIDSWKAAARNGSNETIIKHGFPLLGYVKQISARTNAERTRIIKKFKDRGISQIRGKAIEDIVVIGR